jgi:dTDP-4-dehydrorhamnose 3,5-epimerase-like enzyme
MIKPLKDSYQIITFKKIGDETGYLTPIEAQNDIPIDIKRVYYIYDTSPDIVRGNHAHTRLEQVLVCLKGSCDITIDNGEKKETIRLKSYTEGLYIGTDIWREMSNFSNDCILLVFANAKYNEDEYIRDYQEFLKYIGKTN